MRHGLATRDMFPKPKVAQQFKPFKKAPIHFRHLVLDDRSDRSHRLACQASKDMLVYPM